MYTHNSKTIDEVDMLQIAICDDDNNFCEQLKKYLYQCEDIIGEPVSTIVFNDGKDFLRHLASENNERRIRLVFMDIEMPFMSGVETGSKIREELENEEILIVYVSSHTSYAMQLFKIRPMDFIIKPFSMYDVERVVKKAVRLLSSHKAVFSYSYNHEQHMQYVKEIMYFQSEGRKVLIHTEDGVKTFYGKLSELHNNVLFKKFLDIHKSFFVNVQYIRKINSESVELLNGERLPISQKNRRRAMQQFLEINTEYGGRYEGNT